MVMPEVQRWATWCPILLIFARTQNCAGSGRACGGCRCSRPGWRGHAGGEERCGWRGWRPGGGPRPPPCCGKVGVFGLNFWCIYTSFLVLHGWCFSACFQAHCMRALGEPLGFDADCALGRHTYCSTPLFTTCTAVLIAALLACRRGALVAAPTEAAAPGALTARTPTARRAAATHRRR